MYMGAYMCVCILRAWSIWRDESEPDSEHEASTKKAGEEDAKQSPQRARELKEEEESREKH